LGREGGEFESLGLVCEGGGGRSGSRRRLDPTGSTVGNSRERSLLRSALRPRRLLLLHAESKEAA
jgi:hypothetical protein